MLNHLKQLFNRQLFSVIILFYFRIEMKVIEKGKNFIKDWDMFSCPSSLRIQGNSSYSTMFGGFCSLILLGAFIGIFAGTFIDVLLKKNVNFNTQVIEDPNILTSIDNLQFAIGVYDVDLNTGPRLFSNYIKTGTILNNDRNIINVNYIDMVPCQASQWSILGQNASQIFNNYNMSMMICPNPQTKLKLTGYPGAAQFDFIEVTTAICSNDTWEQRSCLPAVFVNQVMTQIIAQINYISVQVYVPDTIINPKQSPPTIVALNTDLEMIFTNTSGSRGTIKLSPYEVQTDQSIFPLQSKETQKGFYIESSQMFNIPVYNSEIMQFRFQCTKRSKKVQRSYRKIDDMLSYAGGLFGIIMGLVGFAIGSYSEYCFEIQVSNGYFKHSKDANIGNFNFLTYIKYRIFEFINCCCSPDWKKMKVINRTRQQMNQQLDMKLVLQKLNYFYFMSKVLLTQEQKAALYLAQPPTIEQHGKIRQAFQESNRIMSQIEQQSEMEENTAQMIKGVFNHAVQLTFSRKDIQFTEDQLLSPVKALQQKGFRQTDPITKKLMMLISKQVKQIADKKQQIQSQSVGQNQNNNKVANLFTPGIFKFQNLE